MSHELRVLTRLSVHPELPSQLTWWGPLTTQQILFWIGARSVKDSTKRDNGIKKKEQALSPLSLHHTHSEFESRMKELLPHYLQSLALPCVTLSNVSLLSLGTFRREPAKRWFDESFAPIRSSEEWFARQYPFGPPPRFLSASSWPRIDHHLSGLRSVAQPPCSITDQRAVLQIFNG